MIEIKLFQEQLNKKLKNSEHHLICDGVFGKKTLAALNAFNEKHQLEINQLIEKLMEKEPMNKEINFNTSLSMKTNGKFAKGFPEGVVVHFTSGSSLSGSIEFGKSKGYGFWGIARDGTIYKTHPLTEWGSHAGKSTWPNLGESLSSKLLGIEIDCPGIVTKEGSKYKSWFGTSYSENEVRISEKKENIAKGAYVCFTTAQEESLVKLILWLKKENPTVFNLDYVLGHDEISPGRKTDPGASLSMTMPDFRKHLHQLYSQEVK